ncbi:MAG: alpha/beta hydrolase family protein [Pirellulaceae bacterium]
MNTAKKRAIPILLSVLFSAVASAQSNDQTNKSDTSRGDQMITSYFEQQTKLIENDFLSEINSRDDWLEQRATYVEQLQEMLGLNPMPERTPLMTQITGKVEHEEFTVENIQFQSRPGLYVTGNLYVPKQRDEKLPAILYVCGHGAVKENGISYGNKVHYHHHGSWFARNGYVCLTIDTLQLGEIEGIHHGTYRYGLWWWLNRGYTPAGVEAWNCIRALDYLQSRKEVDGERLGVTGRSGGGAYSWWIAALDQRIKVAVPVAGITDMRNHVVDGTVEGHCDCMFMVNTYQWDYPMVAALVAPRPLLISNTDNDGIFPLDGVYRTFVKTKQVYDLLGAGDQISLHITAGPHKDTQELRVHAFRWFNHYLKNDDSLIEKAAHKYFEPDELQVFQNGNPDGELNTSISHSFVKQADTANVPSTEDELREFATVTKDTLLKKSFRAWPAKPVDLNVRKVHTAIVQDLEMSAYDFTSQLGIELRLYTVHRQGLEQAKLTMIHAQSESDWNDFLVFYGEPFGKTDALNEETIPSKAIETIPNFEKFRDAALKDDVVWAYLTPRGIGRTAWNQDSFKQTQIKRRFYLLGESLKGMQILDIRRGVQTLRTLDVCQTSKVYLGGMHEMAGVVIYAGLFEAPDHIGISQLPDDYDDGPALLNSSRFVSFDEVIAAAGQQSRLVLPDIESEKLPFTRAVAKQLNWDKKRIHLKP